MSENNNIPLGRAPRRASRLRRVPWGLVGMVALVGAGESVLRAVEREAFVTKAAASWRQAARAARREARRVDVLCFGDSMVKFGVAPRVVESTSGLTAYNLAPYGGPPTAAEALFRRALAAGAKPKAVVVDFMPHLLAVGPRLHLRLWQEMITPAEALRLARDACDITFVADVLLGRVLVSYRDRHEIRANLNHALQGGSYNAVVAHYVTPLWRHWRVNLGAEVSAKNPDHDDRPRPDDSALFPTAWRADPSARAAVRRFLDLARDREIPVFWLLPPLSPATQALREQQGHDAAYERLVRTVAARYANVTVVDARRAGFPHTVFTDPVHLDRDGAAELSSRLAVVLTAHLDHPAGAPRWVALPPRPAVALPDLEDLEETRQVVQAIAAHARR